MKRLIMFNMISVDGFFEAPGRDINWHTVDEAFNDFAIQQLDAAEGLIFGRVTYQLMAEYWPTPAALQDDPGVATRMNSLPKIVFSRTLDQAEWSNTRLVRGDAVETATRLRQEPGGDWLIFGSANLASALTNHGLIDEYRLMVSPLVLGSGSPLFQDLHDRLALNLADSKVFPNGNILLYYRPLSD